MQELIDQFIDHGLTEEQAQRSIQAISSWLNEHYPVAGTIVSSWIRSESAKLPADGGCL